MHAQLGLNVLTHGVLACSFSGYIWAHIMSGFRTWWFPSTRLLSSKAQEHTSAPHARPQLWPTLMRRLNLAL